MKTLLIMLAICLFSFTGLTQKTTIERSWRDPATLVKMGQFNKILVVAFVKNEQNRKRVEDDIIKQLKSKAVASYTLIEGHSESLTEEKLSEIIKREGFDGAIVMQLMNPNKELTYSPGTGTYPANYNSLYPYYGGAHNKYHDEDYFEKHDLYVVETNIYSLKDNKLIWNGITNTVDPASVDKIVASLGKAITNEMKRQGFLY
jgi:hypothetical protein